MNPERRCPSGSLSTAIPIVTLVCSCGLSSAHAWTGEPFHIAAIVDANVTANVTATNARSQAPVDMPRDVASAIGACWTPPHEGDEVTFRMSFKRDGSVFGKPRITYMKAAGGPDGEADLATSVLRAIEACAPLPFTPRLGAAIAGRVFLIRLVAPRKERRA